MVEKAYAQVVQVIAGLVGTVIVGFVAVEHRRMVDADERRADLLRDLVSEVRANTEYRNSHPKTTERYVGHIESQERRIDALEIVVEGIRTGNDKQADRFTGQDARVMQAELSGGISANRYRLLQVERCCERKQQQRDERQKWEPTSP